MCHGEKPWAQPYHVTSLSLGILRLPRHSLIGLILRRMRQECYIYTRSTIYKLFVVQLLSLYSRYKSVLNTVTKSRSDYYIHYDLGILRESL